MGAIQEIDVTGAATLIVAWRTGRTARGAMLRAGGLHCALHRRPVALATAVAETVTGSTTTAVTVGPPLEVVTTAGVPPCARVWNGP